MEEDKSEYNVFEDLDENLPLYNLDIEKSTCTGILDSFTEFDFNFINASPQEITKFTSVPVQNTAEFLQNFLDPVNKNEGQTSRELKDFESIQIKKEIPSNVKSVKISDVTSSSSHGSRKKNMKKRKKYEMDPCSDEEEEMKRLNAIKAKDNREKNKAEKKQKNDELSKVVKERDALKLENAILNEKVKHLHNHEKTLENKCQSLLKLLNNFSTK